MGGIGRGRQEPGDLVGGRADAVFIADGAQAEIACDRVRREHRPVVGRHDGDGRGAGPCVRAGKGSPGAVRDGGGSTTIDQGVGEGSCAGGGCSERRVREGDRFDQGLNRGRGQGGIGNRGEGDLQRRPVDAILRGIDRTDHDVGIADGTARNTDLPRPSALIQHAQLVTRITVRSSCSGGNAERSPPKIETVVGQVVVRHRHRAVDLHCGPGRGVGLGVVQPATEACDHRGVIDGGDVDREGSRGFGHAAGVGDGVGKGHAAPMARRLRGVVAVPDLAILDVLQSEHAAHAQLADDHAGGGVAFVEIPHRGDDGETVLDLGTGAVGVHRGHDVGTVAGVGGPQQRARELQGAALRHAAGTVVGHLGRLVGRTQQDRNGGGGTGGAIAVGHRVLEGVLGRGPVGG